MTRRFDPRMIAATHFLDHLIGGDGNALSPEERCELLGQRRAEAPDRSRWLDLALLMQLERRAEGLKEARANIEKLKEVLDKLTAPPWHAAVFFRGFETAEGPRALVYQGGGRRVVGLADGLSLESFQAGDEVFLTHEMNAIIEKSPYGVPQVGETACFNRYLGNGRLVVECRDEELIINVAGSLSEVELKAGDEIRWDKSTWMAYEKIERAAGRRYFLDDVPDIRPEQVGGQRANLRTMLGALKAKLVSPELAKVYELDGQESILMIGPPGCGKTLMARLAAAEIARTSGMKCRFAVVKPGEFEDPFVGVTQRNIRNCFESLHEAAEDGFAVLFFDEIETIGRLRGSAVGHHSDKFLGALLAEIDGFKDRSGVALMAATNRKDLCDPALLERLSGIEISVDRPDLRGAREIFGIHLSESLPYHPNGQAAPETRQEIIDRAASQLYAPNADNELCTLKFRDGKTRSVSARELASGRIIEQICRETRRSAFQRHLDGGDPGLRVEDVDEAVSMAIDRLSTTLTPRNAHAYLFDLPQDVDVVAVDVAPRRAGHSHRYLNHR